MALTYNDIKNDLVPFSVVINGKEYQGKFSDVRFDTTTLPYPKQAYSLRHLDDDWGTPASITRNSIMVNFFGIFICENIKGLESRDAELDIDEYCYDEDNTIDISDLNYVLRKFILENGETVETIEGETTEKSIHIDPVFVKGVGFEINEIIADSDPEWDEVVLSDCREADLSLAHLDDEEIKQLIDSIYGFEYEY